METLKYVVKRIVLAIVILLGVSVIIYALARMMPTDFVDQQYAGAVAQGTMTQGDVDNIKELYGLNMPDAFLTLKVGEGSEFKGLSFSVNTKADTYEEVKTGKKYLDWYTDNTRGEATTHASYDGKNDMRIMLFSDKTYQIGQVKDRSLVAPEEVDEDTIIEYKVAFISMESGTYELVGDDNGDRSVIRQIKLKPEGKSSTVDLEVSYRTATGGEKAAAVLKGYFNWLGNLMKGDLGMSFKYKQPVNQVIVDNMGISFAIAFIATILQFAIAIPLGIKAAVNQYGVIDYTVTVLTMIGISLPTFFLGAIVIRIFAVDLHWFETGGIAASWIPNDASWIVKLGDNLWHMIMPMFVLVVLSIGSLMRYTRTNTLEALNADYVRTARAKGLSERTVIYKHAFRNTMIPLVTLLAGTLPSLFTGAMITETVFAIPGIGNKAYEALLAADVPFIMGYNMFIAILTVLGTLLSDLMYAVVDPRVKIGK